jgi:hypothetical protein
MPLMFRLVIVALALLAPGAVLATAQVPDEIVIDGKSYALHTNPLQSHLAAVGWKVPEDAGISSANWRGYVAFWEVVQNRLVLRDVIVRIAGRKHDQTRSILASLFPEVEVPIVADWYTGALVIPDGRLTQYVHMGYGSSYERYQVIRVRQGMVVEHQRLTAGEFDDYKTRKFEAFRQTEAFETAVATAQRQAPDLSKEAIIDFLMSFYAEEYLSVD